MQMEAWLLLKPFQWLSVPSEKIPDSFPLLRKPYLTWILPSFSPVSFLLLHWSVATQAFLLFLELTKFQILTSAILTPKILCFQIFPCHNVMMSQRKCLSWPPKVAFTTTPNCLPYDFYLFFSLILPPSETLFYLFGLLVLSPHNRM